MTSTSARMTILSAALGLALSAPAANAWHLVTPQEYARDKAAPRFEALVTSPPAQASPAIRVVQPDISRRLTNPVTIEVQFAAGPGRAINMQSFNATYGWLGIDITRRVLEHSMKTANGLVARNVELPPGEHRVTMSITDTSGKTSSETFNLSVSK